MSAPNTNDDTNAGGDSGAGGGDWRTDLGEIGTHPAWEKFKGSDYVRVPRDAAKSYVELQKFVGGEKIPAPREDWKEEDWAAHYGRLGRPENVDGYGLARPSDLPEGLEFDADDEKEIIGEMYGAGLTKLQAKRLYEKFFAVQGKRVSALGEKMAAQQQQSIATLQREWGAAFEPRINMTREMFKSLGGLGNEVANLVLADGTKVGDHPSLAKMAFALRERMGEAKLVGRNAPAVRDMMDPKDASVEYAKLENKLFAMDKSDPEREALVDRMNQIAQMKWPKPSET